jgi:hypothetical protein
MSQNTSDKRKAVDQLTSAFEQLTDGQSAAMGGLKEIQIGSQALLQREALRLSRKLGPDHPRVQQLIARRQELLRGSQRLAEAQEAISVRVPEVDKSAVLVYGRILDENQRGIGGLVVSAVDAQGQVVKAVGQATTEANGYYALPIDPGQVPEAVRQKVRLVVSTSTAKVVHQEQTPLKLTAGTRQLTEVRLDRAKVGNPPVTPRPTPGGSGGESPRGEGWRVFGVVTDAAGQPRPGLMVSLFDKDHLYDDKLGAALTNADGKYEITYIEQDFREGSEPGADLYLTVINQAGKVLYTSKAQIRYNAGREEEFNIRLSEGKTKSAA